MALHFALCGEPRTADGDASMWVLTPAVWNRKALKDMGYRGGVLSTEDPSLDGLTPRGASDKRPVQMSPVAIRGPHNNMRIVAQKGAFVVFGQDTAGMEAQGRRLHMPSGALQSLVVPAGARARLLASLEGLGVTHSVVYPDLSGLASDARRAFGFEG